jgi:molybdate transport system substrate-binding protein
VPRRSLPSVALVLVLAMASCGASKPKAGGPTTTSTAAAVSGSITVFAASSLTDAFNDMGKRFAAAHDGTKVTFSFAASSTLATQVNQGAPADVLATADEESMATAKGSTGSPVRFARNILQIIVAKGNPNSVTGLDDFRARVSYALCDAAVPCGNYSARALQRAGITPRPRSYEVNVKAVVGRVTSGEVDAGIVYRTDVVAAKASASGVDIGFADDPDLQNVYPIALTRRAKRRAVAQAWLDYVVSPAGQRVLASYAFLPPP